jgi:ATP-dependent protease ClpP protease subunit
VELNNKGDFMKKFSFVCLGAFIVAVFLTIWAGDAEGRGGKQVDWSKEDQSKIIVVSGEVGLPIIQLANDLTKQAGEPVIRILINSPGGSVLTGNIFIQAMENAKARGSKIDCLVTNMAASMGMHILAHCSNRQALNGAILLFHEARRGVSGSMTARELRRMSNSMEALTYSLEEYLVSELKCDPKFYREHNEGETMWTVAYFNQFFPGFKLNIVDSVVVPTDFNIDIFNPLKTKIEVSTIKQDKVGSPIKLPGVITNGRN